MEKTLGSKVGMFLDSSFLGSVTAGGGVSWARRVELMNKKITEKARAGRDRDMSGPFGHGERINEGREFVVMEGNPHVSFAYVGHQNDGY